MSMARNRPNFGRLSRNEKYERISVERLPYLQALIQSYRFELLSSRMDYRDRDTRERRAEVEAEIGRLSEIQEFLILARRSA